MKDVSRFVSGKYFPSVLQPPEIPVLRGHEDPRLVLPDRPTIDHSLDTFPDQTTPASDQDYLHGFRKKMDPWLPF